MLQGKTPYAMLYGKPANLGHLRVFGCQSFACNLPKRDKFAPRARKAIFIGYSETQKGYRLCDPDTHIVLVSRDVKFQKYVFPFKQTYSSHDKETLFSQSAENTFDPNLPPLTAPQNTLSSTPQDEDDNSTPALTDHASTSDLHNPKATLVNENQQFIPSQVEASPTQNDMLVTPPSTSDISSHVATIETTIPHRQIKQPIWLKDYVTTKPLGKHIYPMSNHLSYSQLSTAYQTYLQAFSALV